MCAFPPCISLEQYLLCLQPRPEEQEVAAVKPRDLFPKLTSLECEPQGSRMVFPKEQLNLSVSSLPQKPELVQWDFSEYFYFDIAINERQQHLPTQPSGVWPDSPKQTLELAHLKTLESSRTKRVQIQFPGFESSFPSRLTNLTLRRDFNHLKRRRNEGPLPNLAAQAAHQYGHNRRAWTRSVLSLFHFLLDFKQVMECTLGQQDPARTETVELCCKCNSAPSKLNIK